MRIRVIGAIAALLAYSPFGVSASPQYTVSWSQPEVSISVAAGQEAHIGVSLTSRKELASTNLSVVPALKAFVTTEPSQLPMLPAGQSVPVWLRFAPPSGSRPGVYQGTIHLRKGAATIALPLKIRLKVLSAVGVEAPVGSGRQVTVISDYGRLEAGTFPAEGIAPPTGMSLPFGLLDIRVAALKPGASVRLTIQFPTNALGSSVYKYSNGQWADISGRAIISREAVSYIVTDGGDLDADGLPNGSIVDPVALAISTSTYSSTCNPVGQYANYAEQIGKTYQVPAEVLKAVMLQESGWRQFTCDSSGKASALISGDGGIGLMQVTCAGDSCPQGRLSTDAQGKTRIAIDTLTLTSTLKQKLKDDWKYNLEVGARILLAKKGQSDASGTKDPLVIENWYYPLARYNGYRQYSASDLNYCVSPGPYNDPIAPCYSRNSLSAIFNRNVFPYQELIYGHIAGYSKSTIDSALRSLLPDIKATLPGPRAACDGAGKFKYLVTDFRGGDIAIFEAAAGSSVCGLGNAIRAQLCEPSAGVLGDLSITKSSGSESVYAACVHKPESPADSNIIVYTFAGQVTELVRSDSAYWAARGISVSVGKAFSGRLTYDKSTGATAQDPGLNSYYYPYALKSFEVTFAGNPKFQAGSPGTISHYTMYVAGSGGGQVRQDVIALQPRVTVLGNEYVSGLVPISTTPFLNAYPPLQSSLPPLSAFDVQPERAFQFIPVGSGEWIRGRLTSLVRQ